VLACHHGFAALVCNLQCFDDETLRGALGIIALFLDGDSAAKGVADEKRV
jgi:hypothetical protein